MPQSPTPNLLLIKPTELGDSGVWAQLLDAMFDRIDLHDHSSNFGVKVPLATGVTIGADIPWTSGGVFYAITRLKALDFEPQASAGMSTYAGALFMNSSDNELYWRSSAGALVKFTNGANFNFAAIGAIGGDYVAAAALFDYVDATGTYRARQEIAAGAQQWAIVQTGGVDLYEFKLHPAVGVPGNQIRLRSPAGLAAPYTMTFPGAVPGAGTLSVSIDNTGQLAFGASEALSVNNSYTVSGTGLYKHGTKTVSVAINAPRTGAAPGFATGDSFTISGASPQAAVFQIENIPVGARITAIRTRIKDSATGPTKIQMQWFASTDGAYGAAISSSAVSAGSGAAQTLPMTGLTTIVAALTTYTIQAITTTGAANTFVYAIDVDYDQP